MPILERAANDGAQVWFDLERYEVKHVTHRLVRELLGRPELVWLLSLLCFVCVPRLRFEFAFPNTYKHKRKHSKHNCKHKLHAQSQKVHVC